HEAPEQGLFRWVWGDPGDDRADGPDDDQPPPAPPPPRARVRGGHVPRTVTLWGAPITPAQAPTRMALRLGEIAKSSASPGAASTGSDPPAGFPGPIGWSARSRSMRSRRSASGGLARRSRDVAPGDRDHRPGRASPDRGDGKRRVNMSQSTSTIET